MDWNNWHQRTRGNKDVPFSVTGTTKENDPYSHGFSKGHQVSLSSGSVTDFLPLACCQSFAAVDQLSSAQVQGRPMFLTQLRLLPLLLLVPGQVTQVKSPLSQATESSGSNGPEAKLEAPRTRSNGSAGWIQPVGCMLLPPALH